MKAQYWTSRSACVCRYDDSSVAERRRLADSARVRPVRPHSSRRSPRPSLFGTPEIAGFDRCSKGSTCPAPSTEPPTRLVDIGENCDGSAAAPRANPPCRCHVPPVRIPPCRPSGGWLKAWEEHSR
eukprot:3651552-Rhodomonas_salina.1